MSPGPSRHRSSTADDDRLFELLLVVVASRVAAGERPVADVDRIRVRPETSITGAAVPHCRNAREALGVERRRRDDRA